MPEPTLTDRVENLERKMELLEGLPERVRAVELQIGQLRSEMREQLSELRTEMREGDEETRRYRRVLHEEVLARIATLHEGLPRRRKR
jgi:predicted  nucleic acid-binding Zn-ribbon protein